MTDQAWKEGTVGDKGGKKDREKSQKQKAAQQQADAKAKEDRRPKSVPK